MGNPTLLNVCKRRGPEVQAAQLESVLRERDEAQQKLQDRHLADQAKRAYRPQTLTLAYIARVARV